MSIKLYVVPPYYFLMTSLSEIINPILFLILVIYVITIFVSLARGLLILLIFFWKHQLFFFLGFWVIFSYFQFYFLLFIISFLLLALGLFCSSLMVMIYLHRCWPIISLIISSGRCHVYF